MSFSSIAPYGKAVTGAVVAGLGAVGVALTPDPSGVVAVTPGEWVGVASATLVASLAVWAIPNKDPKAQHQDESVQPPTAGSVYFTGPVTTSDPEALRRAISERDRRRES